MQPSRPDGYLTTNEAAVIAGVKPGTIRQWRKRGRLKEQGLDERGWPLHTLEAVRAAEQLVRANGIRTRKTDPRRQRGRRTAASQEAAA